MDLFIGVDVGTTAVKALAIDAAGRVWAEAAHIYDYVSPQPGWIEQNAEDWRRLAWECVKQIVQACHNPHIQERQRSSSFLCSAQPCAAPEPVHFKALALSTQGDTIVPVDEAGRPLAPAITWMDSRTQPYVQQMQAEQDFWIQLTGSRPGAFAAATKIYWWRDFQPAIFARAKRFALVADYLCEQLTGRALLDAPNASRTMLYNIHQRCWAPELLQRADLTEERLAPTAESGTIVGPLLPHVAEELGLPADLQVVIGGHDQTCAAVGCGVIQPGSLMLSCGTAFVVLAATEQPLWDPTGSLQTYCHVTPGGYAVLGAFAGGNLLKWFRDTLWHGGTASEHGHDEQHLLKTIKRFSGMSPTSLHLKDGTESSEAAKKKKEDYELIVEEAAEARAAGRPPVLFLPHFYGLLGPLHCPTARGGWLGLTLQHTRGDMAFALLNGVALQTAWTIESLAQQGLHSHSIRMIGGAARSHFWAQLMANATGLPIMRLAVKEAAAYGAALIAATALGAFNSLEEAVSIIPPGDVVEPQAPPNKEVLISFQKLVQALMSFWEQLSQQRDERA